MPRVALRPIDSFHQTITHNFDLVKGNKTNEDIAKKIRVKSATTVSNRSRNPGKMTLDELFYLCESCHVDIGQFLTSKLRIGV